MVCNICGHRFQVGDNLIMHYLNKHQAIIFQFKDVKLAYEHLIRAIFPYYDELFDDYKDWK